MKFNELSKVVSKSFPKYDALFLYLAKLPSTKSRTSEKMKYNINKIKK